MNPDLDLTLERVIRAPRAAVWSAWTDPSRFEKWWVPAPTGAASTAWTSGPVARL
jgi:uncharacterized protein YndB with AHSA1/START domain